jgi:F-type H+-transporting ATPase subunit epsilon
MADTFKFELVSPERVLLSEQAEHVVLPGSQGDFGVLPGHAPLISTLRPGVLNVELPGAARRMFVNGGFAEVEPDRLTVLAETAFDVGSAEASRRIAAALETAELALAEAADDQARFSAQDAVDSLKGLQQHRG